MVREGTVPYRRLRVLLLVVLTGSLTLAHQYWVGGATIYDAALEARRAAIHEYILHNKVPIGVRWSSLGANGTNIRIGAVFLAEAVHQATGVRIHLAYKILDTVALFGTLLLLFVFLRIWFPSAYALVGLLYVASVLPMTYFLHAFHPWDRLGLLGWLVSLLLLHKNRLAWLALALMLTTVIKYDIILFPGLYFLAKVDRQNWRRIVPRTVALFAVTFGTYAALRILIPGGFDATLSVMDLAATNLRDFLSAPFAYPQLLAFTLPLLLGAISVRSADRFVKACFLFGVLLFVPLLAQSNFIEIRAQMAPLVLTIPAGLLGLFQLLERGDDHPVARQSLARSGTIQAES
jgi:hypothetical protein